MNLQEWRKKEIKLQEKRNRALSPYPFHKKKPRELLLHWIGKGDLSSLPNPPTFPPPPFSACPAPRNHIHPSKRRFPSTSKSPSKPSNHNHLHRIEIKDVHPLPHGPPPALLPLRRSKKHQNDTPKMVLANQMSLSSMTQSESYLSSRC